MAGDERPLVSVVVPMFNEEAVVERCLTAIDTELATLTDRFRFEVLVVDDGSVDQTRKLALAFAADHPDVRVLAHSSNFRLGQALRFAFGQSRGDYVVTFDADLSYSPDHIARLLDTIVDTGARIVIASPYMPGGKTYAIPFVRRALSRGANTFLAWTATGELHTVTGMVRAYDGPFIRTLALKAVDVDVNTEIIYKAQVMRARIVEIPAVLDWRDLEPRRAGRGFNSRLYWTTAKQLVLGFLFRPFMFFLVPGALVGLAGLATAAWVVVADKGTYALLWAALAVLAGVQLVTLALISFQAKRYFEELYHLGTTLRRDTSAEPRLHRPPADRSSAP